MDAPLKELLRLGKLEEFPSSSSSSRLAIKYSSISDPIEALLQSLQELKQQIETGSHPVALQDVAKLVDEKKKEIDEKQREIHSSLGKLGKSIDKKFAGPLPSSPEMFTSEASMAALQRTISHHFVRSGQFDTSYSFREEAGVDVDPHFKAQCIEMHRILSALEGGDIGPALEWVNVYRSFLSSRSSPLEFHLHRSHYLRLLTSSSPPHLEAIRYLRSISPSLYNAHSQEIHRLLTCIIYLPLSKLITSPYADLANPSLHMDLKPAFAREYCASLGMSKQLPLRVVGDIGGGGALSRIEKGRKVMRERKSEWSQTNELPIEIPLPPENRYHSIFACPVSKEQSTEANPPMMMGCGHVVNKDSLEKLKKAASRVKCPYCPAESSTSSSLRVYF